MQAKHLDPLGKYRRRSASGRDEADFVHIAPLDPHAHGWLQEALTTTEPGHEWLALPV